MHNEARSASEPMGLYFAPDGIDGGGSTDSSEPVPDAPIRKTIAPGVEVVGYFDDDDLPTLLTTTTQADRDMLDALIEREALPLELLQLMLSHLQKTWDASIKKRELTSAPTLYEKLQQHSQREGLIAQLDTAIQKAIETDGEEMDKLVQAVTDILSIAADEPSPWPDIESHEKWRSHVAGLFTPDHVKDIFEEARYDQPDFHKFMVQQVERAIEDSRLMPPRL